MKTSPSKRSAKETDDQQKKLEVITYRIALLVSAVSVYYFLIKILFL